MSQLCIEAPSASWSGVSIVVSSVSEPQPKVIEHAGMAYHERATGQSRAKAVKKGNERHNHHGHHHHAAAKAVKKGNERHNHHGHHHHAAATGAEKKRAKKVRMHNQSVDLKNYYKLLHLEKLGMDATLEDIKKAFRETSLIYHPDKNPETENIYKAIQEANVILSDVRRRRVYDSTLDFDDSIPEECKGDDFYVQFGAAFKRNGCFSEVTPLPSFGDAESPFEVVDHFYDFWFGFKSWRDFSSECEHNPSGAENRDERRWMEKQNEKVTNALVKAEAARIRKLVDRAFKIDPRIKAQRQREKQEKIDKKNAKNVDKMKDAIAAKDAAQKEQEAKAAAQALKAEEAAAAKRTANDAKRAARQVRKSLRESIVSRYPTLADQVDIDELFVGRSVDELKEFLDALTDAAVVDERMTAELARVYPSAELPEASATPLPKASVEKEAGEQPATPAPKPAAPAKSAAPSPATAPVAPSAGADWTVEELSLLAKGIAKFPGGTHERWVKIAKLIPSRTPAAVIEKAKDVKKSAGKAPVADAMSTYKKKGVKGTTENISAGASGGSTVASTDTEKVGADWTAAQHAAFEHALRTVPKSQTDRWSAIAKCVPGKDKKDCVQRFKTIKADLHKQTNGN